MVFTIFARHTDVPMPLRDAKHRQLALPNGWHIATSSLVQQYDLIAIEDLNVAGMKKNRRLSKSVSDASFSEFRRQLEYKSKWAGKDVHAVGRFFPSSKMCSQCGQLHEMPLKQRTMKCDCGNTMDRDLNAAINIRNEGLHLHYKQYGVDFPFYHYAV